MNAPNFHLIDPARIVIGSRRRKLTPERVSGLVESVKEVGLL